MLRFFGFGTEETTADDAQGAEPVAAEAAPKPAESDGPHVLYLNLVMLNNDAVIDAAVEGKLPKRAGPLMRRAAKRVVHAKMSDESLGLRLGRTLAERLPEQMLQIGVDVEANLRYVAATLVVVELALKAVDGLALLDARAPDNAEKARAAIGAAGYVGLGAIMHSTFDNKMMAIFEEKLQTTLPEMLCAKLQEKGLEAHAYLRPAATQAALFFDLLDSVAAPGCVVDDE